LEPDAGGKEMSWEHTAIVILSAAVLFFAFLAWLNDKLYKEYRKKYFAEMKENKELSAKMFEIWKELYRLGKQQDAKRQEVEGI
jgi:hypothetical protein